MGRNALALVVVTSLFFVLLGGCRSSECPAGGTLQAHLSAAGITRVTVVAGDGSLHVRGGAATILAAGKVCAPTEAAARGTQLLLYRKGDTAVVETRFPFTTEGSRTHMDLTVDIPAAIPVSVVNKGGHTLIEQVVSATVADLAGDLLIRNIPGSVTITRSANGNVRMENVRGSAAVQDDLGGSLELNGIGGNVVLQHTRTDRIGIRNVQGDVVIWSDGRGNIDVRDVQGELFIQSDSGGTVRYSDIRGSVHLPPR